MTTEILSYKEIQESEERILQKILELSKTYFKNGFFYEALKVSKSFHLISSNFNEELKLQDAKCYAFLDQHEGALDCCQEVLRFTTLTNSKVLKLQVKFYFDLKEYDNAMKVLDLIKIAYTGLESKKFYHYYKGNIYLSQKNYSEAINELHSCINAHHYTRHEDNFDKEPYFNEASEPELLLGKCFFELQYWGNASNSCTNILRHNSNHIPALCLAANCAFNRGVKKKAEVYWKRVLDLDPNNLEALKGLEIIEEERTLYPYN